MLLFLISTCTRIRISLHDLDFPCGFFRSFLILPFSLLFHPERAALSNRSRSTLPRSPTRFACWTSCRAASQWPKSLKWFSPKRANCSSTAVRLHQTAAHFCLVVIFTLFALGSMFATARTLFSRVNPVSIPPLHTISHHPPFTLESAPFFSRIPLILHRIRSLSRSRPIRIGRQRVGRGGARSLEHHLRDRRGSFEERVWFRRRVDPVERSHRLQ